MDIWVFALCVFGMGLVMLPVIFALAADPTPPRPNKPRKRRPF